MAKKTPQQLAAALDKAKADLPAAPPPLPPALPKKSDCPITLAAFLAAAKPLQVRIGDAAAVADVMEFSSGSFGWHCNSKIVIEVGGIRVQVQVGINLIAVRSKEAPRS